MQEQDGRRQLPSVKSLSKSQMIVVLPLEGYVAGVLSLKQAS